MQVKHTQESESINSQINYIPINIQCDPTNHYFSIYGLFNISQGFYPRLLVS